MAGGLSKCGMLIARSKTNTTSLMFPGTGEVGLHRFIESPSLDGEVWIRHFGMLLWTLVMRGILTITIRRARAFHRLRCISATGTGFPPTTHILSRLVTGQI